VHHPRAGPLRPRDAADGPRGRRAWPERTTPSSRRHPARAPPQLGLRPWRRLLAALPVRRPAPPPEVLDGVRDTHAAVVQTVCR
jgi:hypothetical protein